MNATVRELAERGVALSTLYPATLTLYRKSGYAPAGCLFDVRVPAKDIGVTERTGTLRPATDADLPRIQELYGRVAAARDGRLARGPYIWNRIKKPRTAAARAFVVEQGDSLEGYLFASQHRTASEHFDLSLSDICAATPFAARKLLSFLYDHRSIAEHVLWRGGQADALLLAIPERVYEVKLREHWMLRICNVGRALEARGYPAGVNLSLELEVLDDVVPTNSGRLVLTVSSGRGRVEAGGAGKLRLDVRALAALYTGFQSPTELALSGALQADASSLVVARTLFSGPLPEMPDFF
jgi:predicted acetyltransferase